MWGTAREVHFFKLDAVSEQQDPPCTLFSQTSAISQRAIISNMSKTEKNRNHIRRLECGLHNVNYGDSQINLFCLTHNNISLITAFSHRFFLTTFYNVCFTMAFSQRLSHNVFLTNVSLSQRLSHNVVLTTFSHNIPLLIASNYTRNLSTMFGRLK